MDARREAQTASQLRKLQRLVESLVVKELDPSAAAAAGRSAAAAARGSGPPIRAAGAATTYQPAAARHHRHAADEPPAPTSRPQQHSPSLASSDLSSLDLGQDSADPLLWDRRAQGLQHAGERRTGGNAGRALGFDLGAASQEAAAARGRLNELLGQEQSAPAQFVSLQGQLALMQEQLNSAYKAADSMSPPRHRAPYYAASVAAAAAAAQAGPGAGAGGAPRWSGAAGLSPGGMAGGYAPTAAGALDGGQGAHGMPGTTGPGGLGGHGAGAAASERFGGAHAADMDAGGLGGGWGSDMAMGVAAAGLGPNPYPGTAPARRAAAEEYAAREAVAREEERLRNWIQDLRSERRKLEDRLLDGDTVGLRIQQMREDLEKQVLSLSRQRDQLAAEMNELGVTRAANAQLMMQVESLEAALAVESERVARYKEIRPALEARLEEVGRTLDGLRRQHAAAVERLGRERDTALLKAKRSARQGVELEAALGACRQDNRRLEDEVRAQAVALAEVRASSEAVQAASQQLQVNLEAQTKETATRLAMVQSQLEGSQSECVILRHQVDALQQEVRDRQAEADGLRSERDRLASELGEERQAGAAARAQAEGVSGQLKASEDLRSEAAKGAAAQMEILRRQHAAEIAALQKQYESQLAASEKQYLLLQRQYDAGVASSEHLADTSAGLRRERDALWAEAENLRAELEAVRQEKSEVAAKLAALRSEVRTTMEEVARDRDARLSAAASHGEALVRDVRGEAEQRLAAVQREYEQRLEGMMDTTEKARADAAEAQRHADKHKATVAHLRDQVRDLLLSRDATERELASERAFNDELNRILAAIRGERGEQGSARGA